MIVSTDGGAQALKQLGIKDADMAIGVHQRAVDWANERAAELVGMRRLPDGSFIENPNATWRIDEATRDFVRSTVLDALGADGADGMSWTQLRDALAENYAFSAERAETIARTELARADVAGNMLAYRESGVVEKKRWLTAGDDAVSEDCQANADQGEIDLDEDFQSGADAPPEHPNCRCDLMPIVAERNDDEE